MLHMCTRGNNVMIKIIVYNILLFCLVKLQMYICSCVRESNDCKITSSDYRVSLSFLFPCYCSMVNCAAVERAEKTRLDISTKLSCNM